MLQQAISICSVSDMLDKISKEQPLDPCYSHLTKRLAPSYLFYSEYTFLAPAGLKCRSQVAGQVTGQITGQVTGQTQKQ